MLLSRRVLSKDILRTALVASGATVCMLLLAFGITRSDETSSRRAVGLTGESVNLRAQITGIDRAGHLSPSVSADRSLILEKEPRGTILRLTQGLALGIGSGTYARFDALGHEFADKIAAKNCRGGVATVALGAPITIRETNFVRAKLTSSCAQLNGRDLTIASVVRDEQLPANGDAARTIDGLAFLSGEFSERLEYHEVTNSAGFASIRFVSFRCDRAALSGDFLRKNDRSGVPITFPLAYLFFEILTNNPPGCLDPKPRRLDF